MPVRNLSNKTEGKHESTKVRKDRGSCAVEHDRREPGYALWFRAAESPQRASAGDESCSPHRNLANIKLAQVAIEQRCSLGVRHSRRTVASAWIGRKRRKWSLSGSRKSRCLRAHNCKNTTSSNMNATADGKAKGQSSYSLEVISIKNKSELTGSHRQQPRAPCSEAALSHLPSTSTPFGETADSQQEQAGDRQKRTACHSSATAS